MDVTDFQKLRLHYGDSRVKLIKDTVQLIEGNLRDPGVRQCLKQADRIDILEWVDGIAQRNADAVGGKADLSALKERYGVFTSWMKAGKEGQLGGRKH